MTPTLSSLSTTFCLYPPVILPVAKYHAPLISDNFRSALIHFASSQLAPIVNVLLPSCPV